MRRSSMAFFALVVAASGASAQAADDRGIDDFPAGPGREETANLCAACHTGRLVSQQGLSREQWNETLDVMTARHKMPKLDGAERELILSYLTTAFPPRAHRGRDNPFLR